MPGTHRQPTSRRAAALLISLALAVGALAPTLAPAPALAAPSATVVISQVYGGGGNTGATYTHDYVELFNRGDVDQSLAGWSVQYASATGTGTFAMNSPVALSGSIPPGGYYLVRLAGGTVGAPLPTPDTSSTAPNMGAGAGKVIVANSATGLACNGGSTPCSEAQLAQIVDLIGYGNANFFEGSAAAPGLSVTTSAHRAEAGCIDTDNNSTDFAAAAPSARNSSTAPNICHAPPGLSINDVSASEGNSGTSTFAFTVSLSSPAGAGGVTFDIATADGTATTAVTDYVASSLTGQTIAEGSSTYQFNVTVNGDTVFEGDETFLVNVTGVSGATVGDGQGTGTIVDDDACTQPATLISAIQGTGPAAAMTGVHTIQGRVVGDYQGTGQFAGYFVQEEDADWDTDPLTSEGIFVFNTATAVSVGDIVRVRGTAGEFAGMTQLSSVTSTVICSTGITGSSATVTLPVEQLTDLERYEGMHISIAQELAVTEVFTLGRFGEVALSVGGRLDTPTNEVAPGAEAAALQNLNDRSRILLDDANNQQNIDPTNYPQGGLSATNTLRVGDTLPNLTGILEFRFSTYRVQPVSLPEFTHSNPRPVAPDPVGGDVQVAAFNVLNYFNGNGTGLDGAAGGFPTARGANTLAEFNRQRAKTISAITQLDADVIGLMELENDDTDVEFGAIEDLVAGLNAATAPGTWAFIDTGIVGTDAIRVGLIYQPGSVAPVGDFAIIDSTVDPRFVDTLNRPSVLQTFATTSGTRFSVLVNHLKSKSAPCGAEPDTGDGQGCWNPTRTNAAEAIVDWLATDPTDSGDPDVIVIGDLNAYAMEDPITVLRDAGYVDAIDEFVGDNAYSFVFQGQSGYLDHALASPSLAAQISGVTEWHINADEPIVLDYNVEFKTPNHVNTLYDPGPYRSSDHDPVLVGIDLTSDAPTIAVSAGTSCLPAGNGGVFALTVADHDNAAGSLTLSVAGNTNPALVPSGDVAFGGSGANRSVSIAHAAKRTGTAVLTIGVSDGTTTTTATITVRVGTDAPETLMGTSGADLLLGAQSIDSISGLAGADVLCGGRGNDTLSGGDGNDALGGERGDDALTGGADADAFSGGPGADTNIDFNAIDGDTSDGS